MYSKTSYEDLLEVNTILILRPLAHRPVHFLLQLNNETTLLSRPIFLRTKGGLIIKVSMYLEHSFKCSPLYNTKHNVLL